MELFRRKDLEEGKIELDDREELKQDIEFWKNQCERMKKIIQSIGKYLTLEQIDELNEMIERTK